MTDLSHAAGVLLVAPPVEPVVASTWDESEHPRHPEGTEQGGQFAPKDSTGTRLEKKREEHARLEKDGAAMHLKDGDIFKFAGTDPGGWDSIQWFRAEQRENGLYAVEIDGDNAFPLSGVVEEVEVVGEVPGVTGPLEPIFPESASNSDNSSSHELYDVVVNGPDGLPETWFVKKVEATKEVAALRDHVEPGRDLERELAAQIVYEEIKDGVPEMLDLRVAKVQEGNIAGLGHVIMSKKVFGSASGDHFLNHAQISEGDARALSLYDWIIGNTDRHTANIINSPGGAVAIDNGLAFPARNSDSFGRFHVIEFHELGGMQVKADQPYRTSFDNIADLHWPDDKQGRVIGHLQENWERIDKRLEPYLNENERRAMWRRVEWVANGQGRFPSGQEWASGAVDELVQGYGWHESVTLGRDEEANAMLDVYDAREVPGTRAWEDNDDDDE